MSKIFWTLVAIDATLFLILLIATLTQRPTNDGGKEMALFFTVLVPGFILAVAIGVFVFSSGAFWRVGALLILAGPGLLLGAIQLRNVYIDHVIREMNSGRGYFTGRVMKQLGAAVVARDVATIEKLAPNADVNTLGERDMTLLRLAVDQSFDMEMEESKRSLPSELPVIKSLLAHRADPNSALETATKIKNAEILRMLLVAGADANYKVEESPVIFSWLTVLPEENIEALIAHGLDVNETDRYGTPLIVEAGRVENWKAVLLLLKHGADRKRTDKQGMNIETLIPDRINSHQTGGNEIPPGLLHVQNALREASEQDAKPKKL